jgi:16S rRNA (cytidine1402-2'-O)-methyltransferase
MTATDVPDDTRGHYLIGATALRAPRLDPGLYLVATPIGNLGDVTLRGLETLAAADRIYCEDSRVTRVLLDRYGIRRPLAAYHEHNGEQVRPRILEELAGGAAIALVSDAGTPLISDPGFKLVGAVAAAGHKVVPIPGASALIAGLVASGLATDRFLFVGFLPAKAEARRQRIAELAQTHATLILYESPHRLDESLAALAEGMGADRPAAVCRELTKTFEEVRRGPLATLAAHYAETKARGEIVIVIGPAAETAASADDVARLLAEALRHQPPGKAAADVARLTGADRKALYQQALALKEAGRAAVSTPTTAPMSPAASPATQRERTG